MPGMNIALEIGLNCPDCGGSDRCEGQCVCPACWLPSGVDEEHRDKSVEQWLALAPLLAALNGEEVYWGWSTEPRNGIPKHSLEIASYDDDSMFEVFPHEGGYLVTHYRWTRGIRETNTPPEVQDLDEVVALTVDEAMNALTSAIPRR